jgi:hypothetical protein
MVFNDRRRSGRGRLGGEHSPAGPQRNGMHRLQHRRPGRKTARPNQRDRAGRFCFGVLVNPKFPPAINQAHELEAAAPKIGRSIFIVHASNDVDLEVAFVALLQKGVGGLVVASDPFFDSRRARIIAFAAEKRRPVIYQFRDYAVDGQGCETIRSAGDATHEVRFCRQPEDRQCSWREIAAIGSCRRRRGTRMMTFVCCSA